MKQGLLVGAADNNGVDLLNYTTGAGLWGKNGKGTKVTGPLTGAVDLDGKVLLTSGGKDCAVILVDAAGTEIWEKKVKLDGTIKDVTRAMGAWVIASSEEVQVVNPRTGVPLLDRPFKGGAGTVAVHEGDVYVFKQQGPLAVSHAHGRGSHGHQ